jgi:hypothetical protein
VFETVVGEARVLFPLLSIFGFLIVGLVIAILLCVWVYRDAESRMMNGGLWLIIVLISGPVGLIVYLIVRGETRREAFPPTRRQTKFCSTCGRELAVNTNFCPHCGKAVQKESW